MRVLVCGGRDYADKAKVDAVLDELQPATVIEGGASGADRLAKSWCDAQGGAVEHLQFAADWGNITRPGAIVRVKNGRRYDAAAGSVRNQRMLDEGKPDLVVAFPGGTGTADMVRRAKRAGVQVQIVEPSHDR